MAKRPTRTKRLGWSACVEKCKEAFEPTNAVATQALANLYGWQDFVVSWASQTPIVEQYAPEGFVTNPKAPIFALWEWAWDEATPLVETMLYQIAASSSITTLDVYNNLERLKAARLIYPDATIAPVLETMVNNEARARERESSLRARLLLVDELKAAQAIKRLMPDED